jgi:O-acetyl-ADP-ribose deacetylase (regulator of RNase III)
MITYVKGNLLEDDAEALVNTVNTVGVMGKGIALQFKKRYPEMFDYYKRMCHLFKVKIGEMLVCEHSDLNGTKVIINFPTKKDWKAPAEYWYIQAGLMSLVDVLVKRNIKSLAMPALGCGNGGLEWEKVKALIENQLSTLPIDIRVYDPE